MLKAITEVVTVAAAGTPVQCTITQRCCAIRVKNPHAATGYIYVGLLGLTKATGGKVIDDPAPGEAFELGRQTESENTIDPADFRIDADGNGQVALVTGFYNV